MKASLAMLLSLFLLSCSSPSSSQEADLIVLGGRIWTGNPQQPWAEALAVKGDRIAAVGTRPDIEALGGEGTEVIEAQGGLVTPGFIDSHVHFLQGGANLASVQLRDASSRQEFVRRIEAFAGQLEEGEWILGGDWDHERWGGELPQAGWIDQVTPRNPVMLNRLDGHMVLANSAAMKLAGVDARTEEVEGGTIVRDRQGRPTGIFKDNAMGLIQAAVPQPTHQQVARALEAAQRHVARQGVTSVHNMGTWNDFEAFREAHRQGQLRVRIYAAVPLNSWERLKQQVKSYGRGDEWLRVGGLKGFVDGSLGSHTAAFLEPFSDAPQDRGLLVNELDDLYRWISAADGAGLQVMTHAIGDRAIRELLDIYQRVAEENGERDRRFRIEHAQHIHPDDIQRFAAQDVIASMQPYHAIDDGRWAEKVIGPERIRTTYAFRSLVESGATVAFGSDWFVAPPTPLEGIYAALTRRTLDGANPQGWVPEEKISLEQALQAYTRNAAYASFQEDLKGTLEKGKLADFVVIDRDLSAIPAAEIREAQILRTVVGGEVVFSADEGAQ
ncbi:MAG TPA: amidohydrolase [Acidobacteriota bacterium]|nr:amidohydrolase [Acidobacteriota bacterium]